MAKQTALFFTMAFLLLQLTAAAQTTDNTPEAVTTAIVHNMHNPLDMDFEQLRTLTTPSSAELLERMVEQSADFQKRLDEMSEDKRAGFDARLEEAKAAFDPEQLTCTEAGDNATCTFCCNPGTKGTQTVYLEKIDGRWLVNMTKK